MSAVNVVVGQTVKLDLLVTEGGPSLFPQAVLLDGNNIPLAVSPLNLISIVGDLYSATFTMPNTLKVTAISRVYSNSIHTIIDNNYDQSVDEFISLVENVADLTARVTELVTISRGVLANAANSITVDIESSNVEMDIEGSNLEIDIENSEIS